MGSGWSHCQIQIYDHVFVGCIVYVLSIGGGYTVVRIWEQCLPSWVLSVVWHMGNDPYVHLPDGSQNCLEYFSSFQASGIHGDPMALWQQPNEVPINHHCTVWSEMATDNNWSTVLVWDGVYRSRPPGTQAKYSLGIWCFKVSNIWWPIKWQ